MRPVDRSENRCRTVLIALVLGMAATACGDAVESIDVPAVAGPGSAGPSDGVAGSSPANPVPGEAFNAADIEFLVAMLPHHIEARRMTELAERRADSPDVRALASRTRAAQAPEVEVMARWLQSLGIEAPTAGGGHAHGGAMTEQDVRELATLSGSAFDRRFLDLLTDHSVGATTLARAETSGGLNSGVRQLAATVVEREWADIALIRRLG